MERRRRRGSRPGLAALALLVGARVADGTVLVPLPEIVLQDLEPAVAERLQEAQQDLLAVAQDPRKPAVERGVAYGELGMLLHAHSLPDPAEACYRNAERLDPREFRWPYYLGVLLQEGGRLEEAVGSHYRALASRNDYPAAWVHLGEIFLQLERLEEAKATLETAMGAKPAQPAAAAILGQVALSEERFGDAVQLLEAVLQAVPEADRLHYPLALAYRGLGELDKAQQAMERRGSVGLRPPDPLRDEVRALGGGERIHLLRGRMAFQAGRYAEAAEAFREAAEADPESARAHVNLGTALGRLGDYAGAARSFRRALEIEPRSATAHFNLGSLLASAGSHNEAREHLQEAAVLDPADGQTRIELGKVLRRSGMLEAALEAYTAAIDRSPFTEDTHLGAAATLVDLGRYDEARQRLSHGLALLGKSVPVAAALARLLAGSPDPNVRDGAEALELAEKVYAEEPTIYNADTLAMSLAQLGRCREAAEWQRKALETARAAEAGDVAAELEASLRRYERGEPCAYPAGTLP